MANEKKPMQGIKIENPFTFKVLQVFTGFGFGCGIGIGQGVPINMGTLSFFISQSSILYTCLLHNGFFWWVV